MNDVLLTTLIAGAFSLLVALIGYLNARGANASKERTETLSKIIEQVRIDQQETNSKLDVCNENNEELRKNNAEMWRENRELASKAFTLHELVSAYRQYAYDQYTWHNDGEVPPPPVEPFALRKDLKEFVEELERRRRERSPE